MSAHIFADIKEGFKLNMRAVRLLSRALGKRFFISDALMAAFTAAKPFPNLYLSALIINELMGARDAGRLMYLTLWTLGVNFVMLIISCACKRYQEYTRMQYWARIERIYMNKLFSMDFQDIENPETAGLLSSVRQNANFNGWGLNRLEGMFRRLVGGFVKIGLSAALGLSLFTLRAPAGSGLAFLDSPVILSALALCALMAVVLPPYLASSANRMYSQTTEHVKLGNRLYFFYAGTLVSETARAKDARIYSQRFTYDRNCFERNYFSDVMRPVMRVFSRKKALGTLVTYLFSGCVYVYAGLKALSGAFGAGLIMRYVGALTNFAAGFGDIFAEISDLRDNLPFLRLTFKFLDVPNRMYMGSLSVEKRGDMKYVFELRDVGFRYPGSGEWALRHVNLTIRAGEKLAVVGKNGSGKTTLVKLLCRLYDPEEGEILLNDFDIRKYDYVEYMNLFSVVFQDYSLFALPLGENVAVAREYDRARAMRALAGAGLNADAPPFSKGLDTALYRNFDGEGVEISGGEAQKIALARALYKDAPFVMLDEPTAALDPLAEADIYSRFGRFVGARGAVFISHRLSSCRFCDTVAVFDSGRLVERGTHAELEQKPGGVYAALWQAQAKYYAAAQNTQSL